MKRRIHQRKHEDLPERFEENRVNADQGSDAGSGQLRSLGFGNMQIIRDVDKNILERILVGEEVDREIVEDFARK